MSSFYVQRTKPGHLSNSYTGPIHSEAQALKEAKAWKEAGWFAAVVRSTAQVRKAVREWERAKSR